MKLCYTFIGLLFVVCLSITSCKESASGPGQPPGESQKGQPEITSIEPESGVYGTVVTITGNGFGADTSLIDVEFNGLQADVDSASSTVIYTTVPEGASSGSVNVGIGDQSAAGPEFEVITTGAVEVRITTKGPDQDRDGYIVNIDLQKTLGSSLNDTLLFRNVEQGDRRLGLKDLDNACSVSASNPRTISVVAQDTTPANIEVVCEEIVLKNKIIYERGRALYAMNPDGTGIEEVIESEMDQSPSVSPDGQRIATVGYNSASSEENPNSEIYIIDASGYPAIPVTNTMYPINNSDPSWSPDGEKILFSLQDEEIWNEVAVIHSDGTGMNYLTDNDSNDLRPSWSPDGSRIAFASDRDNSMMSIFLMQTDGSNITQLTDNTNYDDFPQWSPDGSKIVYLNILEGISGNDQIFVMDSDGSNKKRLTFDESDKSSPSWSPDGTRIVFTSRVNDQWDIFIMNSDGSELTNLSNSPDVSEFSPSWSPVQ